MYWLKYQICKSITYTKRNLNMFWNVRIVEFTILYSKYVFSRWCDHITFFFKFHEFLRVSFVFCFFFSHNFSNDFQLFLFIEFSLNCLSRSKFLQHCSWNINNSNEFINSTLIFWNCSIFLNIHACSKIFVDV